MGVLVLVVIAALIYRHVLLARARRTPPRTLHMLRVRRWLRGRGPDPREAMFCNGVPTYGDGCPYDVHPA